MPQEVDRYLAWIKNTIHVHDQERQALSAKIEALNDARMTYENDLDRRHALDKRRRPATPEIAKPTE